MQTTPEFAELFTKWIRQLFSSINIDHEIGASEGLMVDASAFYIGDLECEKYHVNLLIDHLNYTCDEDACVGDVTSVEFPCKINNTDLVEAFSKAGLQSEFEIELIGKLGDENLDQIGAASHSLFPCIDCFQSPITPFFFDLQGNLIENLSKQAEDIIAPMLSWSLLLEARNQLE